jgi:spore germination protein GerM
VRPHRTAGASNRRSAPVVIGLLVGLLVVALAACGIAPEDQANRIDPTDVPFGLLEEQATTTEVPEGRTTLVYLAAAERLVAVERSTSPDATLADLLEQVVAGPTETERALGITTVIPAGSVAAVDQRGGVAQVDLTAGFGDVRTDEQLLALGQIVYTLTEQPGIGGVAFSLEGEPVGVPLPDGSTQDGPVSRDDLASVAPR